MKWAIAQGYRADNPAGDAISAALPSATVHREHHKALPHAEVGAALGRIRRSGVYRCTVLEHRVRTPLGRVRVHDGRACSLLASGHLCSGAQRDWTQQGGGRLKVEDFVWPVIGLRSSRRARGRQPDDATAF